MAQIHLKTNLAVRSEFCSEKRPEPCGLIIFGASGDLTHRKLLPALFELFQKKLMPEQFYIVGFARSKMTDEVFRQKSFASLKERFKDVAEIEIDRFVKQCFYIPGDYQEQEGYNQLATRIAELDQEFSLRGTHLYYLSVPPTMSKDMLDRAAKAYFVDI